jgi:hypothetical protein
MAGYGNYTKIICNIRFINKNITFLIYETVIQVGSCQHFILNLYNQTKFCVYDIYIFTHVFVVELNSSIKLLIAI